MECQKEVNTATTNTSTTLRLKIKGTHIMKCQRKEFRLQDPQAPTTNDWNSHGQEGSIVLRQQVPPNSSIESRQSPSKSSRHFVESDETSLKLKWKRQGREQAHQFCKRRTNLEDLQCLMSILPIKYNYRDCGDWYKTRHAVQGNTRWTAGTAHTDAVSRKWTKVLRQSHGQEVTTSANGAGQPPGGKRTASPTRNRTQILDPRPKHEG